MVLTGPAKTTPTHRFGAVHAVGRGGGTTIMAVLQASARLSERHLRNARIVPDRSALLPYIAKGCVIAEVGVALGDFSKQIVEICRPAHFIAIDLFQVHHNDMLWGRPTADVFEGRTHRQFYADRMAGTFPTQRLSVMEGDSAAQLRLLPDRSVDVFYVDADHTYASCAGELSVIKHKIRDGGVIILNDYQMCDIAGTGEPYGVIQAAHEFMLVEGWEMLFLALQELMYCDVMIRKIAD